MSEANAAMPVFVEFCELFATRLSQHGFAITKSTELLALAPVDEIIHVAILIRRQRFPSDKRIVFSPALLIGVNFEQGKRFSIGLKTTAIQKALLDGNMQKSYSLFPSTSPQDLVDDAMTRIETQWLADLQSLRSREDLAVLVESRIFSTGNLQANEALVARLRAG